MADLQNTFSWSSSRDKICCECARRYYWHYYGSWEGWRAIAPEKARLAYRLKNMTTLKMWAGSVVHETIEAALRGLRAGKTPNAEETREQARRALNNGWRQSVSGEWRRDPKRALNLFEHYYATPLTADDRAHLREHVFACIDRFFASEAYAMLCAAGAGQWMALEDLQSFTVQGAPVWVKLDAAIRDNGRVVIIDWKTGDARESDAEQLGVYALYALSAWKTPPESLEARLVYLRQGVENVVRPDSQALIDERERIGKSIARMKALLDDADRNRASMERFAMEDDEQVCVRCSFKELCER